MKRKLLERAAYDRAIAWENREIGIEWLKNKVSASPEDKRIPVLAESGVYFK